MARDHNTGCEYQHKLRKVNLLWHRLFMKDNPILVPLKIQHFSEFQIWELNMGFAVEVAVCY